MTQTVNVSVPAELVTLTPLARVVRTLLQVAVAVGAAIPIILNTGAITDTKTIAILSAAVVVVTTLQNVLEHIGVLPVIGATIAQKSPVVVTATPPA
jgi:hypothetical protein